MTTAQLTASDIGRALEGHFSLTSGRWSARCPAHDDRTPSLTIKDGDAGVLVKCHSGCTPVAIITALKCRGLWADAPTPHKANGAQHKTNGADSPSKKLVAAYDYVSGDGQMLFQVVRYEPKGFGQRRPDGNGSWTWSTAGVQRVLYRLPAVIAAIAADQTIYIAEGEKGVHALEAIGSVGTCSPGGAGKWRPEYSGFLTGADIVILTDNDPQATMPDGTLRWHPDGRPVLAGQDHAMDVARHLQGVAAKVRVLMLPNLPSAGDVADWVSAGGTRAQLEALVVAMDAKHDPGPEAPAPRGTAYGRLQVLSTNDLDTAPPRDYLMKGLISPAEISIWVGAPKCGKSFLLLYVAYRLSLGQSIFGRRVKPTIVLYIAAEGEAGIAKRIRALRDKCGPSENFHFIGQPIDLLRNGGHKLEVIDAATAVRAQLIIVDTLNRAMAGGDENSPMDMGTFVGNISDIKHQTGAHVAIVHHGTKSSNGSSPRGHGSLEGADDALIEVAKLEDGSRVATVIHAKDDADGMRWGFTLDVVELGTDEDGDPISTLIVVESSETPQKAERAASLSDNLQIGMKTLHGAIRAHGIHKSVGQDHAERSVVAKADWRAWFYREGKPGETQENKRKAFQRTVAGLLARNLISSRDGFIWPETAKI